MKPGYKTTEFWMVVAGVILGKVVESGACDDNSGTVCLAVSHAYNILLIGGYAVSRGVAKKGK